MTTQAAIYLRVSSDRQDAANQELQVRALCTARGYVVADNHVFRVTVQGDAETNETKEACEAAAHRGEFQVIVVWALDRWTREGIVALLGDVERLRKWGVAIVSVLEPWADTTDGGAGELMLAIAGWSAKQEKKRLRERNLATAARLKEELRAGPLTSKRTGRVFDRLGRPKVHIPARALERARELRAKGWGWRNVARELRRLGLGEWKPTTLGRAAQNQQ